MKYKQIVSKLEEENKVYEQLFEKMVELEAE